MKIYSEIVLQMNEQIDEYTLISQISAEYCGPVVLCKGDSTAKAAEQQQMAFNAQLMSVFQQQYANQQGILNFMKPFLQDQIMNPKGFSDAQMTTLQSQAKENAAASFQNATQAAQERMATEGNLSSLPSGVAAQITGGLSTAEAAQEAGAQQNIQLANAAQQQQNYWNAFNALNGVAAQENPVAFAGAANQGGDTVANLSNAVTNSQQSGWLNALLGGVAGAGSAFLGNPNFMKGCWIAEAIWGVDDYRTHVVREYLNTKFCESPVGCLVMALYAKYGQRVAEVVRKNTRVRKTIQPLFELAFDRAIGLR